MTTTRTATCRCGQLQAVCTGDPIRVSVCHCLNCQKRSGSAFAVQARWPLDQVTVTGAWRTWRGAGDSGEFATFRFCDTCGGTLAYENDDWPGVIAIAVGGFADPAFPPPWVSVYEARRHPWAVVLGDHVERWD